MELRANSYVVVASHGNYDELALEAFLPSKAAYVALVASKKRTQAIRSYLAQDGVSDELLARLKYPAGLDIGAVTPAEIALSILAEIIQVHRRGRAGKAVRRRRRPGEAANEAIDPVCGMTVEIGEHQFVGAHTTGRRTISVRWAASGSLRRSRRSTWRRIRPKIIGLSAGPL